MKFFTRKAWALPLFAAVAVIWAGGCVDWFDGGVSYSTGSFTDARDGQKYKTTTIDGQTWMARNLNYEIGNSWCYNDSDSYCDKYGRLYDWETALEACPAGWHLPTTLEWWDLTSATNLVGVLKAGEKLKAKEGWSNFPEWPTNFGKGTDDYEFSALPGGMRSAYNDGGRDYSEKGVLGWWWAYGNWEVDHREQMNELRDTLVCSDDNEICSHIAIWATVNMMSGISSVGPGFTHFETDGYSIRCVKGAISGIGRLPPIH
jgi:uncharacterized protein (TIGR02145 family)